MRGDPSIGRVIRLFLLIVLCWVLAFVTTVQTAEGAFVQDARTNALPPGNYDHDPRPTNENMRDPGKYALLIGCSEYIHLSKSHQLSGPEQDVSLIKQLISQSQYGFNEQGIVCLVQSNDEAARPYFKNICREFEALCDRVKANDQVLIFLAGHGSQQPDMDDDDQADRELDGMDEVFLPADIPGWGVDQPVQNVITDDQIRDWINRLRDKGAFVFFVADTCHSGSIDRGPGEDGQIVRSRMLPPNGTAKSRNRGPNNIGDESPLDLVGGLVALYAVPEMATEKEGPMPPDQHSGERPIHGRLTYALSQILIQTKGPISYAELDRHLRWQYQAWGWFPYPFVSGGVAEKTRTVLGRDQLAGRSELVMTRQPTGELSLGIGRLSGVFPGTIFKLMPAELNHPTDQVLGHVKVVDASPTHSTVETCAFGNHPLIGAGDLPERARCELVFLDLGDARLSTAVQPADKPGEGGPQENLQSVRDALERIAGNPQSLIKVAEDGGPAEFYLLVDHDSVLIRRKFDPIAANDVTKAPVFGPYKIDDALESKIADSLLTMARAVNLQRLATNDGHVAVQDVADAESVEVQVAIERMDRVANEFQRVDDPTALELVDNDQLRVSISNSGRVPVDVSVLYVESGFRIVSLLPPRNRLDLDNRILPNGKAIRFPLKINDTTLGQESIIVIATRSDLSSDPVNFSMLAQDGVKPAQLPRETHRGPPDNSLLKQLMLSATFGVGSTRGGDPVELADHVVRRITWTVVKQPTLTTAEQ